MKGLKRGLDWHLDYIEPVMQVLFELVHGVSIEGKATGEQLIVNNSERPNVSLVGVAVLSHNLRRHVERSATKSARSLIQSPVEVLREAEVSDFDFKGDLRQVNLREKLDPLGLRSLLIRSD